MTQVLGALEGPAVAEDAGAVVSPIGVAVPLATEASVALTRASGSYPPHTPLPQFLFCLQKGPEVWSALQFRRGCSRA